MCQVLCNEDVHVLVLLICDWERGVGGRVKKRGRKQGRVGRYDMETKRKKTIHRMDKKEWGKEG